jgi:hypothetical protein
VDGGQSVIKALWSEVEPGHNSHAWAIANLWRRVEERAEANNPENGYLIRRLRPDALRGQGKARWWYVPVGYDLGRTSPRPLCLRDANGEPVTDTDAAGRRAVDLNKTYRGALPSKEEEHELALRARAGDESAKNKLVLAFRPAVFKQVSADSGEARSNVASAAYLACRRP